MEEFKTYIFEKSKKKMMRRSLYNFFIFGAIGIIIYLFFAGILGVGLTLVGAIALIAALLKMKIYDDKYMGITAYGDRGKKFMISENSFRLGDAVLPFSELSDLIIYVDEYAGMRREIFGVHHGGNNEIRFIHNGQKYNLNYVIKNKADFRKVEQLVAKIEQSY